MNEPWIADLARALGATVTAVTPVGGGSVAAVFAVALDDGRSVIAKRDPSESSGLDVEAASLRLLREHTPLPTPAVLWARPDLLVLERLPGRPSSSARVEEDAADALVALHEADPGPLWRAAAALAVTVESATGEDDGNNDNDDGDDEGSVRWNEPGPVRFGLPIDTRIGGLRQPNPPSSSWADFYGDHRLLGFARAAATEGRLSSRTVSRVERLAARLGSFLDDEAPPRVIHGDVWGGNVIGGTEGLSGFIDPAPYLADVEVELAFLGLFSTFSSRFWDRYREGRSLRRTSSAAVPVVEPERVDLYQLFPLLVHVRLFGGGYIHQLESTLSRLGA